MAKTSGGGSKTAKAKGRQQVHNAQHYERQYIITTHNKARHIEAQHRFMLKQRDKHEERKRHWYSWISAHSNSLEGSSSEAVEATT